MSFSFESVQILDVDVVNAPCDNPSGGSAIVYVDGSGGPYNYSWQNSFGDVISDSAASIGSLTADTYQFTISTLSGCEDVIEIVIDTDGNEVTDANTGEDLETCDTGEADGIAAGFDLDLKRQQIIGQLNNPNYTVNFYHSKFDAQKATNKIIDNIYENKKTQM